MHTLSGAFTDEINWYSSTETASMHCTLNAVAVSCSVGKITVPILEGIAQRPRQSTAARALLQEQLGLLYPAYSRQAWHISAPQQQRPTITGPQPLDISLSHRHSWVAAASSPTLRVGIDIETSNKPIARAAWPLFLHPSEQTWLEPLPPENQDSMAMALWCQKEAWIKASGTAGQIAMVHIAFTPDGKLWTPLPTASANDWTCHSWHIGAEAIVSLCYERSSV